MKRILMLVPMLMLFGAPAWAALGSNEASVAADAQVLNGQHKMVAQAGYNLHQITLTDGSMVREFVSQAGYVFGVSWQGHHIPNLTQLLGTYMTNLQNGQRVNVIRRRAITIEDDNFVFTSVGHLHDFRGRVYVPGLVPAGLTPEVVQ